MLDAWTMSSSNPLHKSPCNRRLASDDFTCAHDLESEGSVFGNVCCTLMLSHGIEDTLHSIVKGEEAEENGVIDGSSGDAASRGSCKSFSVVVFRCCLIWMVPLQQSVALIRVKLR